jgi:hypothetical protein
MISTLMDMRLPSGAVVNPAETWVGEQPWYSRSGRLKHQAGISIFSIGALMVAVKLESTICLSFMNSSPHGFLARLSFCARVSQLSVLARSA